ncbi:MAG: NlpC/P60 family protein [Clostridium sp.]|nr:NlpC/P60 family protein [Clostridium sp.]
MKNWKKILVVSGAVSCAFALPAFASTNLETGSSLAGISVALNNYYAGTTEPEKKLAESYSEIQASASSGSKGTRAADSGSGGAGQETKAAEAPKETTAAKPKSSAYDSVAVSKVNGSVNIRREANTTSDVTGKIYNDCAATILGAVDGEGGKWYKIQSGSVTGYIKAEYFVTGQEAESKLAQTGTTYGTIVDTPSLRLRETPDLTGKTLTLLSEGAHYVVTGKEGNFYKVAVDSDLEGYVFEDYMKTSVEFKEAVSVEEEKAQAAEEAKRKEEAEKALKALEEVKEKEEAKKTTAASTKAQETTTKASESKKEETKKPTESAVGTIAVNPEDGKDATVAAPTTEKARETTVSQGPGGSSGPGSSSPEVASATRNAVVAYAKQFLGNAYVYGGTSLTDGADCSGFTMSVFSHFGISTGRSSRDQAAKGREIPVSDVKPGDLLFYASGNYINHVALYIGGGQVIHSSTPATGICITSANYRTPCKAVSFLD